MKPGVLKLSILSASIYAALHYSYALAGGVTPDGASATTVSEVGGRTVVNIAPPVSGVSHNTYSDFNVARPGLDLLNSSANNAARYIVNEVTSASPSRIEGELAVVGKRASVILVNPNGITVDGGSFRNTNNVALSTGKASFLDFTSAQGLAQRNVVLDTSEGAIEIGPGGLAGAFTNLELVSKRLRIDGPILNSFTSSAAQVRAVTGDSHVEVNTSRSPEDGRADWVAYYAGSAANPGTALVDITPLGSLTSGRIQIAVTDHGAGVRNAGSVYANVGDFVLLTTGEVRVEDGSIRAARDLTIAAPGNIPASGGAIAQAAPGFRMRGGLIESGHDTDVRAASIDVRSGVFRAGSDSQVGNISLGLADGHATGPTTLTGVTSADKYVPLSLEASGGIGVIAIGQGVNIDGAALKAQQNVIIQAQSIALATQWTGDGAQSGSLTSTVGAMHLDAVDLIHTSGARVEGGAGVNIHAASLKADTAVNGASVQKSRLISNGGAIALSVINDIHVRGSDLAAATDIVSRSASFTQENVGATDSSAVAVNGGMLIETSGAFRNTSSLIQGNQRIAGEGFSFGAVTLKAGGDITNEALPDGPLAVIFGAADDVRLDAGGDIANHSARILSNKKLTLHAVGDVENFVDRTDAVADGARQEWRDSSRNWLGIHRRSSGFTVDYGQLSGNHQEALFVAGGDLEIEASNIVNRGGNVYANELGSIRLRAQHKILNEGLTTGEATFERSCRLFLCRTRAESNVAVMGGLLSAARDMELTAGDEIDNLGGRVLALNDMTLIAPKITAKGVTGYTSISRASGMKAFFGDSWAKVYAADQGGSFTANQGRLRIEGTAYTDGASFNAANGVDATGGVHTVRPVRRDPVSIDDHIGLTSWLWK